MEQKSFPGCYPPFLDPSQVYNTGMSSQQVRRGLGTFFLMLGVTLFVWGFWPAMNKNSTLTILPYEMRLDGEGEFPSQAPGQSAVPAVLEVRGLNLTTPGFLRTGEQGQINLAFVPQPGEPGHAGSAGLVDIFDTHLVTAEARLEIGGVEVRPAGTLARPLVPAGPVTFEWELFPLQAGIFEGRAWFYLRFTPKEGGPGNSRPVSAQRLEIRPNSLAGLSGPQARLAGTGVVMLGLILSGEWLARWIRQHH